MNTVTKITQSELMEFLLNVAIVRPVFIWGAPGIGKSSLVRSFAEQLGLTCVSGFQHSEWRDAAAQAAGSRGGVPSLLDASIHSRRCKSSEQERRRVSVRASRDQYGMFYMNKPASVSDCLLELRSTGTRLSGRGQARKRV